MEENPPVVITASKETSEVTTAQDVERQSFRGTSPEIIHIQADTEHIWFDGTHLVESESRRAEPGKFYLMQTGETVLYEVVEIIAEEAHDEEFDCPEFVDDVSNPSDMLVLRHCYTLGLDDEEPLEQGTERLPRYIFETAEALNMGDVPPRTFERVEE